MTRLEGQLRLAGAGFVIGWALVEIADVVSQRNAEVVARRELERYERGRREMEEWERQKHARKPDEGPAS